MTALSREASIDPACAALLIVDVQNYCAHPEGGAWRGLDAAAFAQKCGHLFHSLRESVLPNLGRLIAACRAAPVEVVYSVIENLTRDGRDRSLDYKISGIDVPPGSWDAQVPPELAPGPDEIVLRKTSSDVFVSTNLDYVLRNLDVRFLIVGGLLTDQCVESAVRHACDLGYLVTLATDACATTSPERHEQSLAGLRGYCRQRRTAAILAEIAASVPPIL
ncbi:MAG TPA: isochorismatase family cysteine hydrolase [Stellaceae bacterium]|nr:isochorismatase family cysteine hydrolase [Stellaceae bacterium]